MPSEAGLGDDVEDGVEDGFGVGRDGGGTFGKDPHDGVEEPGDNNEVDGLLQNLVAHVVELSVESAQLEKDGDEAKHGESEEDPLFAAADEGTDEAGDDHEEVKEVDEVAVGGDHVGNIKDFPEEEGSGDGPVDVPGVVERAAVAAADGVAVAKGHGEVGNGGDEADYASDVAVGEVESGLGQSDSIIAIGAKVGGSEVLLFLGKRGDIGGAGVGGGRGAEEEEQCGEEKEGESHPKYNSVGKLLFADVSGAFRALGTGQAAVATLLGFTVRLLCTVGDSAVLGGYVLMSSDAGTVGALARSLFWAATEADLRGFVCDWGGVGFGAVGFLAV